MMLGKPLFVLVEWIVSGWLWGVWVTRGWDDMVHAYGSFSFSGVCIVGVLFFGLMCLLCCVKV